MWKETIKLAVYFKMVSVPDMYYMPFASVAQKNSPSSKLCADASNFDVCRWTLEEAETKNGKWNFQNGKKWQAAVSSP